MERTLTPSSLPPRNDLFVTLAAVLGVNALGAMPALFIGSDTSWIDKPWFFPPEVAFPVVWTLLFTLLGVALARVWRAEAGPARNRALLAFGGQFAVNLLWTPIFFGLRAPVLGLVVILALWAAVLATMRAFDRVDRRAAALLIPYLAWISYAAVLNGAIAI